MTDTIATPQMRRALDSMCDTIANEKEYLSELDGAKVRPS
jgi:spore coat protein CotF